MNVAAIIANVIDRCGGNKIESLDSASVTLHVLNEIETHGLELADTFKSSFKIKHAENWSAKEGTLSETSTFLYRPQYVRYKENSTDDGWLEMFVLNDIQELTNAENKGTRAVWFSNLQPFEYHLSFAPAQMLTVEIYGQNYDKTIQNLTSVPKLPEEFSQLIAIKAAIVTLDELLLIDEAPRYVRFIAARKETLFMQLKTPQRIWNNFKARDENRNVNWTREPFDIFADRDEQIILG